LLEWLSSLRRGQPIEAACQEKTLQALAPGHPFFPFRDALVFLLLLTLRERSN
jgi:hypothetical protein